MSASIFDATVCCFADRCNPFVFCVCVFVFPFLLLSNVLFCLTNAPTYATFEEARDQVVSDHHEAIRDAQKKHKGDWHNDKKDYTATITRGTAELEDLWINFTPYMDAGCMTARPQTPAKRLAALFRRVGLSHLCITDKDNIFCGLITRRSLITPPGVAPVPTPHGHDEHASGDADAPHDDPVDDHHVVSSVSHPSSSSSSSNVSSRKSSHGGGVGGRGGESIVESIDEEDGNIEIETSNNENKTTHRINIPQTNRQ